LDNFLSSGFKWWALIANFSLAAYLLSYNTQVHIFIISAMKECESESTQSLIDEMKHPIISLINPRLPKTNSIEAFLPHYGHHLHLMLLMWLPTSMATQTKKSTMIAFKSKVHYNGTMNTNLSRNGYLQLSIPPQASTHFQECRLCDFTLLWWMLTLL